LDIEKEVIEIFEDKASMDPAQIILALSRVDDAGMYPLDAGEIVFGFEEEYGIEIPDDQIRKSKKIQDIVAYLVERSITEKDGF
jgi:acyl carrier protein